MGLSSNQARFLSLTSRQIDLEHRIQQICQRRLRLSSELENVSTSYNNSISNRKMFTQFSAGMQNISVQGLGNVGYKVIDSNTHRIMTDPISTPTGYMAINSQAEFNDFVTKINSGTLSSSGKYILNCDIDLSSNLYTDSVIKNNFTGIFDGNGHTISNLNINTSGASINDVGFFSRVSGGATVKNLVMANANVTATNSSEVGALAGLVTGANVQNCTIQSKVTGGDNAIGGVVGFVDSSSNLSYIDADVDVTGSNLRVGGIAGGLMTNSTLKNSTVEGSVQGVQHGVGGAVGDAFNGAVIDSCSGNVAVVGTEDTGGLIGIACNNVTVSNSYSTGSATGSNFTGGLVGHAWAGSSLQNSYTTANVSTGGTNKGGLLGYNASTPATAAITVTNCFYDNNYTGTNFGAVDTGSGGTSPVPLWSSFVWNKSSAFPTLMDAGYNPVANNLEEGLRNGTYSLVREADDFTQDPLDIKGEKYQEVDWRSAPVIMDELYKGDDVDAENKYDRTIAEINAQDKKLQLEQTSVEVEYKAISSEKESVKKILDTNAQSSFKYFS